MADPNARTSRNADSRATFLSHARALVPRRLADVAPGLATLVHYPRSFLRFDLVAGVTVGAVAVPSALAMAELAGVPVVYGLYGTFLPLAVYGLLCTSRQHVIGPDSTLAALTAVTVAPMAMVGGKVDPARYVALTAALALAMGGLLFVAGLLRLGFVADFFGKPVLLGYINGVALIVIASQLGKLLGIDVGARDFFPIIREIVSKLGEANGPTVLLSAGLLVAALTVKRFLPAVPPSLVVLALGLVIAAVADLEAHGIAVVGEVKGGLPPFGLPDVRSGGLPRPAASRGGICARRLRRPDRDRAHVREEARIRDRPEPRAERARDREPHGRADQCVSRFLLQLSHGGQRLQRREIAGCDRRRRCGGGSCFCSSRCL